MLYGMWQSATGIMTSSYRQDVISNNLANAETVGFRRDLTTFQQRLTEAQQRHLSQNSTWTDPRLEKLGGGFLVSPTMVDPTQGELEPTGNPLDVAIQGEGYFAVKGEKTNDPVLTRNGQFMIDKTGKLILANSDGQAVLDTKNRPIKLNGGLPVTMNKDGTLTQGGKAVARIGVFTVDDPQAVKKEGNTTLSTGGQTLKPAGNVTLRNEVLERSNVEPTSELAELMDAQRQLEANANMIRYQDQTLGRLVNEVGKIG